MREILFRGKRISNGEWVYGGIMQIFHPNYDVESEVDFINEAPNCYCICANNKDYFVEQETIGQYTGLTDKNGKKIFEGDILAFLDVNETEHIEGAVKYGSFNCGCCNGVYGWYISENPELYNGDIRWLNREEYEIRLYVKGNIHDNPELLEG